MYDFSYHVQRQCRSSYSLQGSDLVFALFRVQLNDRAHTWREQRVGRQTHVLGSTWELNVPCSTCAPPSSTTVDVWHAVHTFTWSCHPAVNSSYNKSEDDRDVWVASEGKMYVPVDDEEMVLRICFSVHCDLVCHRWYTTTCEIIKEKPFWTALEGDDKAFVKIFLVCLLSEKIDKVPRPLVHQIHAQCVSEVLQLEYLYIGESTGGKEYIFILKDDFSGYDFLRPCKTADAFTTTNAIIEYFYMFVPLLTSFSNEGSHFKNEVMDFIAVSMGINNRFSTAYVPWSNGTVDAVCK